MPVHEDITAAWNEARPILADAFHPDNYMIVRKTRVSDGSGGSTDVEVVVESGKCALDVKEQFGMREGAEGPQTMSVTSYLVEMPISTVLHAADLIYINSRKFDVIGVNRGGDHEVFPIARVEELS